MVNNPMRFDGPVVSDARSIGEVRGSRTRRLDHVGASRLMAPGRGSDVIYNKGFASEVIRQFLDHVNATERVSGP